MVFTRFKLGLMLLAVLGLSACTSIKEGRKVESQDANVVATPMSSVAPKVKATAERPPLPVQAECPVRDVVCTMDYSPVLCSAHTYDGQQQPAATRLMVWGSNRCDGMTKLNKAACANDLKPSKFGSVECVPDPSNGRCAADAPACGTNVKPATCVAEGYGKQKLTGDQILTASETNECLSRAQLRRLACRANLDPELLSDVSCKVGRASK